MKFQLTWAHGREFRDVQENFIIGRKSGDLQFSGDDRMSGKHACFYVEKNHFYIVDLGSSNGTYLNGKRLEAQEPAALSDGDEIKLGNQNFKIVVDNESTTVDFKSTRPEKTETEILENDDKTHVEVLALPQQDKHLPSDYQNDLTFSQTAIEGIPQLSGRKENLQMLADGLHVPTPPPRKAPSVSAASKILIAAIVLGGAYLWVNHNKDAPVETTSAIPAPVMSQPTPAATPTETARAPANETVIEAPRPLYPTTEAPEKKAIPDAVLRLKVAEYAQSLKNQEKHEPEAAPTLATMPATAPPAKKKKTVKKQLKKVRIVKKIPDNGFQEVKLMSTLNGLKSEYQLLSSPRAKNALQIDASEIISKHFEVLRDSVNLRWKNARALASSEKSQLKTELLQKIVSINDREKYLQNNLRYFLIGDRKF